MSLKTICFISGRGSNLHSLIEAAKHYSIAAVLSNKPTAPGLVYAKEAGIPTRAVSKKDAGGIAEQKSELYRLASEYQPDLILLAGYMQIVETPFIEKYQNKIINIHPSLLPKYPGLKPHNQAIEAKDTVHGCTVHLVIPEVDSGSRIAQAKCQIEPSDNPETLAGRVLELEHQLYPWTINQIAKGEITITNNGTVQYSETAKREANEKKFLLTRE